MAPEPQVLEESSTPRGKKWSDNPSRVGQTNFLFTETRNNILNETKGVLKEKGTDVDGNTPRGTPTPGGQESRGEGSYSVPERFLGDRNFVCSGPRESFRPQ